MLRCPPFDIRHYSFVIALILFPLLTLLIAALWMDSYFGQERESPTFLSRHHMHWTTEPPGYLNINSLHSFPGYILYCRFHQPEDSDGVGPPKEPLFHRLGFEWMYEKSPDSYALYIVVPHWQPTILCALISTLLLFRFVRHRLIQNRTTQNACPKCSYDLRAHKPGDKCPECGTLIPPDNQSAKSA